MRKIIVFISIISFLLSCSSAKSTEKAINTGNYNKAISIAVEKLKVNKTKKGNQQYVIMLEDAFMKSVERDEQQLEFLLKDGNPENLERIYNLYLSLNKRQEIIKPLMPLPLLATGKNAKFTFKNYTDAIIQSKNELSDYLYKKISPLVDARDKQTLRNVYYDLEYIEKINPGYKDVADLMNEVHEKGTDYVSVSMKNETETIVPKRLETYLLNFDTYGLNDFWTVYHNDTLKNVHYDYGLELNLTEILVSPERIREKEVIEEKLIKDGFKYAIDDDGKNVKDSIGNKIKVDNFIKVRCEIFQISQMKSSKVVGQVKYIDLNAHQDLQIFPIASEFIFEHQYATHKGDHRALDKKNRALIALKPVPFPTNEQMVFDTGSDLKSKLKSIIKKNKF